MQILKLSLQDFFSLKFLKFALIPLACSLLFMSILGIFGFSFLTNYFYSLFSISEDYFWAWFYAFHVAQVLLTVISFLFSGFIVVFASVFLALFITSFLTPFIVKEINRKYYHYNLEEEVSSLRVFFEIFKIFIKFGFFFILCTLALFLPFVNLFIYYFVFYYLFHKLLILDVTSSVLDQQNFKSFNAKFSPFEFKFSILCFYILSSVPFLGLFFKYFL